MRGTPFLQAIFMFALFLLTGWPVYRLTRPAASAVITPPNNLTNSTGVKVAPLEVEAVFAPAPADFQIKNLDRTVLAGQGPGARFTARWTTTVPTEGVDLVVQAHWPASTPGENTAASTGTTASTNPAATRLTVRFPDGRQVEKSFWADANGTLEEVFTVPGAGTPAAP